MRSKYWMSIATLDYQRVLKTFLQTTCLNGPAASCRLSCRRKRWHADTWMICNDLRWSAMICDDPENWEVAFTMGHGYHIDDSSFFSGQDDAATCCNTNKLQQRLAGRSVAGARHLPTCKGLRRWTWQWDIYITSTTDRILTTCRCFS